MRTTVDLQAVTDRVRGLVHPLGPGARTGGPRRWARLLALAMLMFSAAATLAALGLLIAGQGMMGLRVFCGAVLVLVLMLRLA
jgi:hypothetical protein